MRRALAVGCAALLALWASIAGAHEMTMAYMRLQEVAPGEFLWQWTASGDRFNAYDELTPRWPAGCVGEPSMVRCGEGGLRGTLAIDGIGESYSVAVLRLFWLDGQNQVLTITAGQPSVRLFGSAVDNRSFGEIASAYTTLGIEHILTGFDHLLFVVALLFLVGFERRLVYTITAFTAAHSLTLALSAFGLLTLRPPPVEAAIALSIVLVAAESLSGQPTLGRRWPALVAFLFGLVHGLGFAGALREFGLPQNNMLVALLTFNVGVEIGQLLLVAVAYPIYRALVGWPAFALARVPALYAIGTVAAYWSIGRIIRIVA